MSDDEIAPASAREYPRTCGQCGSDFVAGRRDARWCSGRCRLRAWRQRHRCTDERGGRDECEHLARQVTALQEALERSERVNVCAHHGCQVDAIVQTTRAGEASTHRRELAPWRSAEWMEPANRILRAKITEQADELDRLRQENGLMRRWISEHSDIRSPFPAER